MYFPFSLCVCMLGTRLRGPEVGLGGGGLQLSTLSRLFSREALVPLGQLWGSPESPPRLRGSQRGGPCTLLESAFPCPRNGFRVSCSFVLLLPEEGEGEGVGRDRVSCPAAETIRITAF